MSRREAVYLSPKIDEFLKANTRAMREAVAAPEPAVGLHPLQKDLVIKALQELGFAPKAFKVQVWCTLVKHWHKMV